MRAIPREVFDELVGDAVHAYALGAWCADGYWWSSSIGITNVEPEMIIRFSRYLLSVLPPERLRLRIYQVEGTSLDPGCMALTERISIRPAFKMKQTAYQLYVNSRPLVRRFFYSRDHLDELPEKQLGPYFSGRFDGDGTWGSTPRIVYRLESEALTDGRLLKRLNIKSSVLYYAKANEYCNYIHKSGWDHFRGLMSEHSWKINRRYTL